MMKHLQRLGKSLMLPVACLPIAGVLMGIGYWIDPLGWGANSLLAAFLIKAGEAILSGPSMAILFAIGVGVGMSEDNDGTAALAALVSWLVITNLLSVDSVAVFSRIDVSEVNSAFGKIQNQFVGILSGLIGAACYNKFKSTKLPDALAFFSGKRCVAIITACVSLIATLILFFIWPVIYTGLVNFGKAITSTGAVGAGIYGFFNRLLIPTGLHHALNSVFWFDVADINDLGNFWNGVGEYGTVGMYMSGFFPFMMFGLPAACLAMYHTAKDNKRKVVAGLLFAAAFCSFFTGVTEPIEFSFMFLAPVLYLVHAILAGISLFIVALLPVRAGFQFSGGFIDWFLSFKAPMAQNPFLIIPIGLAYAVVYYFVFRTVILKFNLKTPGREDDDIEAEKSIRLSNSNFAIVAATILEGLGGKSNIKSVDNCITRLRLEIKDYTLIDEKKIKSAGVSGIIRPSKTSVQVVVGTQVQFVADEFKKLI